MKTSGRSVIEGVGRATLLAWLAAGSLGVSAAGHAAESCPGGRDTVLTNGTILTVDAADRTVKDYARPDRKSTRLNSSHT